ncbi:zinc ribbon domain-containing protein [candidate division WOR-3 bacterium]|nr:zinc ribbon domain-containing protein [candidate division WOR-3 bacterium]
MLKIIPLLLLVPLILFAGIKCPYCGAENPDDAKFCWKCGKPLKAKKQENIKKEEPSSQPEQHFIKCPYCGADNPEDAKFCWKCGKPLRPEKTKNIRETLPDVARQGETLSVNEALLDSILQELKEIKNYQKRLKKLVDYRDEEIRRLNEMRNKDSFNFFFFGCLIGMLGTLFLIASLSG